MVQTEPHSGGWSAGIVDRGYTTKTNRMHLLQRFHLVVKHPRALELSWIRI
jgi:hypothetical protein